MNSCPYCSHKLLLHLRSRDRYWYCKHCHLESFDSFIATKGNTKGNLISSCNDKSINLVLA